jgi:hypothetical protein
MKWHFRHRELNNNICCSLASHLLLFGLFEVKSGAAAPPSTLEGASGRQIGESFAAQHLARQALSSRVSCNKLPESLAALMAAQTREREPARGSQSSSPHDMPITATRTRLQSERVEFIYLRTDVDRRHTEGSHRDAKEVAK